MSTSDIKKSSIKYFIFAGLSLIFSLVYEAFSHGVYSMNMILAFLYPLVGGLAYIFLARGLASGKALNAAKNMFMAGIATLTVGSLLTGVLEIYGTSNRLMVVYKLAGSISLALGIVLFLMYRLVNKRTEENKITPFTN